MSKFGEVVALLLSCAGVIAGCGHDGVNPSEHSVCEQEGSASRSQPGAIKRLVDAPDDKAEEARQSEQARLWLAKRKAMKKYADSQDAESMNLTLAAKVRQIPAADEDGERVEATLDGYTFSLPAEHFKKLAGRYVEFESDNLTIRCLGAVSTTGEFAKSGLDAYFGEKDSYEILVDAFNARPRDIAKLDSFEALEKHGVLLLIKAVLQPIGSEKNWERFEAGGRRGILAGDTTYRSIIVETYLPETEEFAMYLILPGEGAEMDDVYKAIGQLHIEKDE